MAGEYGIATVQLFSQPPALSVARIGSSPVQLSWLPGYAGYVLEGRADLASGAWSPIATNPPGNQVLVNPTNATRFFRLRSQ